ncbi:MAG: hypothetical protein AAB564_00475 [Patescibacteria group bacterium]
MNKIKEKIINPLIGLFLKIFGGPPRRYWIFALGFFFLALTSIFALDGIVFWRMNSSAFRKIYVLPERRIETIDQKILTETAETLKARETAFSEIFSAPALKDPSR